MPPKRIVTSRTASKGDWAAVPGMAKTASYSTPCRFFSGERIACHTDFRGTGSAYSDSGARGDPIMHPVVGIFTRREDAERAAAELEPAGIDRGRIIVLTPGTPAERPTTVPTRETEPPGIGTALGTVTGAAAGAAGGMQLGTVLSTLLVPGLGPVIALGALGTVLLGALGAAVGHAFDDAPEGVPRDDLYLYEDALRHGRSVVIALAAADARAEAARAVLAAAGAESLDAFRDRWWSGVRDAEAADYESIGRPFAGVEADYRRGFECALGADRRGRAYDDVVNELKQRYPDLYNTDAFRGGYERGQAWAAGRRTDRAARQ